MNVYPQASDGRGDGVEQASAELDGYVVLKRWVIPFVHRLGDGHDDAGGLTTRLCSGSSENQRTAVGDSLGDDEATERLDQDAEYEVSDEDDGGTFIARKWDFLKSITAGSNQDANTVTDEAKEDALLYLMINTLQAEDSAASQIQAHFLEPVTQTKNAALPGFEEYWIETLHEHGLRVGLQVVQGPFAEQQQEEYQIPVDWSGSPFSYCSADMRTLLPL
ncbi:hypothetical protein BGZ73_007650 [Actinomortierella ambigua]|nr:hypothetical protein BGZ73_007650 [Actinomortierella ambigua]